MELVIEKQQIHDKAVAAGTNTWPFQGANFTHAETATKPLF